MQAQCPWTNGRTDGRANAFKEDRYPDARQDKMRPKGKRDGMKRNKEKRIERDQHRHGYK